MIKIWYVPYCKKWFTSDTFNNVFYWDDEKEKLEGFLTFSYKVSEVIGIPNLDAVAISSFNKAVTLWNVTK